MISPCHFVPASPSPPAAYVTVLPSRGRSVVPLKYKHSAFACFPDLISSDAIINCSRPLEWSRVDTPALPPPCPHPTALYLQFSFVNNKPWRRRGSDFNEGINNPAERGRRPAGGRGAGCRREGGLAAAWRGGQPGEFRRAYTHTRTYIHSQREK